MPDAFQVPGNSAFRDEKPELQQFAVNLRCPSRHSLPHAADEILDLAGHLRSTSTRARSPAPVKAKACAMPADDRFRLDDDQSIRPSRPYSPSMIQNMRSKRFTVGRGCFRFSTETCWRRARTSREVSMRLRKNTRTAAINASSRSNTNDRCNTPSDRSSTESQSADNNSCEILATHNRRLGRRVHRPREV